MCATAHLAKGWSVNKIEYLLAAFVDIWVGAVRPSAHGERNQVKCCSSIIRIVSVFRPIFGGLCPPEPPVSFPRMWCQESAVFALPL
jgi:hypothetical protein